MRMPPVEERSPSTIPSQLSGRRLLSRMAQPFSTKSRSVSDFHISVDDPHRQYSPGDQVSGSVHLTLAKPVRLTHLVVVLHGFVQVYKNPGNPPPEGYRTNNVGSGRGTRSGEYFGNGFASLFEDEVAVCGDGRLVEGKYEFKFVLLFPESGLPSSISFERGTISYMITATLTRPTTMSPTLQCDHKVYLMDRIDISHFYPPKARTITLEPISRRSRAKSQARKLVDNDRKSRKGDSNQQSSGRRDSQTSSSPSLRVVGDSVSSPIPSDVSFESLISSQGRNSQPDANAVSPRPSDAGKTSNIKSSVVSRTISTTVESLTGGCLRGDSIPVRIQVCHTKYVKSLHGIIITLYRQARVDLHPSIPIGPTEKGKEAKYEDYYPRSVTGLGGLSLSGAGSSHVFRKDLSQTILPLLVDPSTLTAEVTGKVKMPEDAFPTISGVPGAMISFQYYIEVVIDIQGKLGSQDRNLGNLGGFASTMAQGQLGQEGENERSAFNAFGNPIIDTASVRRDKGVVACSFEVIVGTHDTQRNKGKRRAEVVVDLGPTVARDTPQQETDAHTGAESEAEGPYYDEQWYGPDQGYDSQYYDSSPYAQPAYPAHNGYADHYGRSGHGHHYGHYAHPPLVPMPPIEDESQLTEKERLQRAEERLMPSRPPGADGQAAAGAQAPTAPFLSDEQMNGDYPGLGRSGAAFLSPGDASGSGTWSRSTPVSIDFASDLPLPATPKYEVREGESLQQSQYRIVHQTSATGSDGETVHAEASSGSLAVPSAPTLDEVQGLYTDGTHDSHAEARESSDLPRYEQ